MWIRKEKQKKNTHAQNIFKVCDFWSFHFDSEFSVIIAGNQKKKKDRS